MSSSAGIRGSPTLALTAVAFLLGCGGPSKAVSPAFPQVSGLAQRQIQFQQIVYPFYVFVPSAFSGTHPLPAVLLIHGGGGSGPDLIQRWKNIAEQNGIILVGPTLPLGGTFETAVAPQLYPMIIEAVRSKWDIDARRIYLFGVSAGGYTVFDACMFDSQYFAAGGVFATVITPDYDWILQHAARKTPIAIYIGNHDKFFTVAEAQRTRDVLATNGFPVQLTIFPNLDHNYGAVADTVNADAWNFFRQASLPQQ